MDLINKQIMAFHVYTLENIAKLHGLGIEVVVFDNQLQTILFKTKYGQIIKNKIIFSKLKPWVRHDEHYHADFRILKQSNENIYKN